MTIKITSFEAENVKRIRAVAFTPTANGLTVIGGNNRQGKTSVLDTIAWLLGGAKFAPSTPQNRDSVGNPFGRITLSNGLVVERAGKNSSLKVTDPEGKKAGQELLNEFISAFALDLPKFMNANDRERAFILLDVLGIKEKLAELETREKTLYDERTDIGRVADSLTKHADELPYYHDAPEAEISAASIIEKQQRAVEQNNANAEVRRKFESVKAAVAERTNKLAEFDADSVRLAAEYEENCRRNDDDCRKQIAANNERIDQLQAEIARLLAANSELTAKIETARNDAAKAEEERLKERSRCRAAEQDALAAAIEEASQMEKAVAGLPPDTDLAIFKADIEKLETENAKFRANQAHDKAAAEAKAKRNEYDAHTSAIEAVRREIMGLLASVKMPLEGLTVKDTLLYYKGQRWDCMSGAEQLIVATSIVRAVNPNCGFVLMDKLEAMDLATLSEFNDWLLKENLQVIATRVSQGDECSIIIEDGSVAE